MVVVAAELVVLVELLAELRVALLDGGAQGGQLPESDLLVVAPELLVALRRVEAPIEHQLVELLAEGELLLLLVALDGGQALLVELLVLQELLTKVCQVVVIMVTLASRLVLAACLSGGVSGARGGRRAGARGAGGAQVDGRHNKLQLLVTLLE